MQKLIIEKIEDGWLLTSIHQNNRVINQQKWAVLCDDESTDQSLIDSIVEELGLVVEDDSNEDNDEYEIEE